VSDRPAPAGGGGGRPGPRPWTVRLLALLATAQLAAGVAATAAVSREPSRHPVGAVASAGRLAARPNPAGSGALGNGDVVRVSPSERRVWAAAVQALLDARASAVLHRDRAAFLAGIDPGSPQFRASQASLFANLAGVPLADWSYSLDPNRDLPLAGSGLARYGGAQLWVPDVTLSYQLAGFDTRPTTLPQYFTFVQRGTHWYLGSDSDFAAAGRQTGRGLWDFGPVAVVRTAQALVLGHPAALPTMRAIAAIVDAAVPRVSAVWGSDWPAKVVVLVPASQDELAQILQSGGDLAQIAAVATADLAGPSAPPAGERIAVNPPNFARLGTVGRQVVLTHEITHVASRSATTTSTPTWLAEGFADYVGYQDTSIPVRSAARELADALAKGQAPQQLPAATDFDGTNPNLPVAYESAWLACRLIADLAGQAGLVRFYRAVGAEAASGATPDQAVESVLRSQLHLSTAAFTARWRTYLHAQLG